MKKQLENRASLTFIVHGGGAASGKSQAIISYSACGMYFLLPKPVV